MRNKKEKLMIIVGAGASIPFGNYTCAEIDNLFKRNSIIKLNTSSRPKTLYKYCSEEINKFIEKRTYFGNPQSEQKLTNFEQVIHEMENIYALTQEFHNKTTGAFFSKKVFPKKIKYPIFCKKCSKKVISPKELKKIDPYDFILESEHLISLLAKKMRQKNLKFKNNPLFSNFRTLCQLLKKEYDIGILNFNYDDIFEEGFSSTLNTGFDKKGKFNPMKIVNGKWNFLYYPHGSLHFDINYHDNIDEYHYEKDLNKLIKSCPAIQSYDHTIEGFPILRTPIIVGYGKAYQIQRNPFSLYINDFAKKIYEADKILFIGYGFNDIYVNNLIRLSMNYCKKRKVVVIDSIKGKHPTNSIYFKQYENNLCKTIPLEDFSLINIHKKGFNRLSNINQSFSISFQGFELFIKNPYKLLNELK